MNLLNLLAQTHEWLILNVAEKLQPKALLALRSTSRQFYNICNTVIHNSPTRFIHYTHLLYTNYEKCDESLRYLTKSEGKGDGALQAVMDMGVPSHLLIQRINACKLYIAYKYIAAIFNRYYHQLMRLFMRATVKTTIEKIELRSYNGVVLIYRLEKPVQVALMPCNVVTITDVSSYNYAATLLGLKSVPYSIFEESLRMLHKIIRVKNIVT